MPGGWHKTEKGRAWFKALRLAEKAERERRRHGRRRKCRFCGRKIPPERAMSTRYCQDLHRRQARNLRNSKTEKRKRVLRRRLKKMQNTRKPRT